MVTTVALFALWLSAPLVAGPASAGTPEDAVAKAFASIESDPVPEAVTHRHFVVSNENGLHFFRPHIEHLGGVHIGVGTDQNYMLAGWSRPEVLVLMDYDKLIVALHHVYRVAFLKSANTKEFAALWERTGYRKLARFIKEEYAGDPSLMKRVLEAHDYSKNAIRKRLNKLRQWGRHSRVMRSFVGDREQFAHLKGLFEKGRVIILAGDLMGAKTIAQIGEAATKSGLAIRSIYLSNAEQYQRREYHKQFRANMLGLPFDSKGVVLRTMPRPGGGMWYYTQPGKVFHEWLRSPNTKSVFTIINSAKRNKDNILLRHINHSPRKKQDKTAAQ